MPDPIKQLEETIERLRDTIAVGVGSASAAIGRLEAENSALKSQVDLKDESLKIARIGATSANKKIDAMEAEIADLKSSVVTFCALWAAQYARDLGLPDGHLPATYYDILKDAGARMDSFVRSPLI
ncbi:hypothetical protein G3A39_42475 [Paraburkholderia aspalathi]|nr:hypothetical protein [Paraburkholderia aspalathi]